MFRSKSGIIDWIRKKRLLGGFEKKIFRHLLGFYYRLKWLLIPIDDKKVMFCSFMGRSYSCSPRAIYEAMLKDERFKDFHYVWVFTKADIGRYDFLKDKPNTTLAVYEDSSYERAFATSRYSIVNSRLPVYFCLRKNQIALQCWHGTPLKRLGHDIVKGEFSLFSTEELCYSYRITVDQLTYFLSPSKTASEIFTSAFALKRMKREDCILEAGYPRNDILANYKDEDIKRIKQELKIPAGKKVCLYAPTWRDNQHVTGKGYSFELPVDFGELQEKLGKDHVIVFRPHYFIAEVFDFTQYAGFVFDGSKIDDVNDLYIISDVLITDYSSVFFDYANLKRPIIFYMYDLEEYQNQLRDFYFDLNELPGPIVSDQEELIQAILKCECSAKITAFNKRFNYLDDGKAAQRVIDRVFNDVVKENR